MKFRPTNNRPDTAAFTMVEIAICLAIIGFALVAIIGVLPLGMNTQRDNREETIINQDATVLLEAVRNGTHGADDLTNYVYAITNYWQHYNNNGVPTGPGQNNGFSFAGSAFASGWPLNNSFLQLPNGAHIVGLMSTPEFTDVFGVPVSSLINGGFSNHVVAYVRSLSGLAAEKPPQDNQIMKEDTFSYRILCVNAPVPFDTNSAFAGFSKQLSANLHELRMTFLWPQLPNGKLGNGHQTFRATIAGQLLPDRNNNNLHFYQSQSFTNAP